MALTIIIKEGKKDRERRVYDRAARDPYLRSRGVDSIAKHADEAADMEYHLHGEQASPILVEGGEAPRKAFITDMEQIKQDPERVAKQWGLDLKGD